MITLGGGKVIDPSPGKSRRIKAELHERLMDLRGDDKRAAAEQVIYLQSTRGVWLRELSIRTGLSEKQVSKVVQDLASHKQVLCVEPGEKRYLHIDHVSRIGHFVCRVLQRFHEKFPEREGMTRAELGGKLSLLFKTEKEVEVVLKHLVKTRILGEDNKYYHLPNHEKSFSENQQSRLQQCIAIVEQAGYQPPRRSHLLEQCGLEEKEGIALLKMAFHNKLLVRIADDLYYTPGQLEKIDLAIRQYFEKHEQLTVIAFKELLQISRKHAVELLEYFDMQHLTARIENHRILRAK